MPSLLRTTSATSLGTWAVGRDCPTAIVYILADSHGKVIVSLKYFIADPMLLLLVGYGRGGSGLSNCSKGNEGREFPSCLTFVGAVATAPHSVFSVDSRGGRVPGSAEFRDRG